MCQLITVVSCSNIILTDCAKCHRRLKYRCCIVVCRMSHLLGFFPFLKHADLFFFLRSITLIFLLLPRYRVMQHKMERYMPKHIINRVNTVLPRGDVDYFPITAQP